MHTFVYLLQCLEATAQSATSTSKLKEYKRKDQSVMNRASMQSNTGLQAEFPQTNNRPSTSKASVPSLDVTTDRTQLPTQMNIIDYLQKSFQ